MLMQELFSGIYCKTMSKEHGDDIERHMAPENITQRHIAQLSTDGNIMLCKQILWTLDCYSNESWTGNCWCMSTKGFGNIWTCAVPEKMGSLTLEELWKITQVNTVNWMQIKNVLIVLLLLEDLKI